MERRLGVKSVYNFVGVCTLILIHEMKAESGGVVSMFRLLLIFWRERKARNYNFIHPYQILY